MIQDPVHNYTVVDLIFADHKFIKECLEVFSKEKADPRKMELARPFLDAVQQHSLAERKAVYANLKENEELHFMILESQVEHDIVDLRIKDLKIKIERMKVMSDEVAAEFKVVAELLKHHILKEEEQLLPHMREEVDEDTLREMGSLFIDIRNLKPQEGSYDVSNESAVNW
jgi:hemerythrin-like domain-containing protein